jgi:hypothetical protein
MTLGADDTLDSQARDRHVGFWMTWSSLIDDILAGFDSDGVGPVNRVPEERMPSADGIGHLAPGGYSTSEWPTSRC